MYAQAWFDSEPERAVANMLDGATESNYWVRLGIGDLPILWSRAGNWYNPDLIAVEQDGTHWIVEVKSDKDLQHSSQRLDPVTKWTHASIFLRFTTANPARG